jgi:hypothetical protein
MRQINNKVLQKGDIILTTSAAFASKAIRAKLKSDISHAMLYVAEQSVIDSTSEGVQARNIQRMFYPNDCAIYVLRLKEPIPSALIDAVIFYVRNSVGTPYATAEAARSATKTSRKGTEKQFCSRLVARAYASVGIFLSPNPDFCSPEDIKASHLLVQVENPGVWVCEEKATQDAAEDGTERMREITRNFLKIVRGFEPKVLSLSDAISLALSRPDLDKPIAEAYASSGYLDHWKLEVERYPWRYDLDEMLRLEQEISDVEAIRGYCETTLLDDERGTFNHWKQNLAEARTGYRETGTETFRVLYELYENLVSCHEERIAVARAWLASNRFDGDHSAE